MKKLLTLLILTSMLAACQPYVFGVPQSTWDTLTPAQRQQVIDGYNQRKAIQEQNAPIQNAINTAGMILNNPN